MKYFRKSYWLLLGIFVAIMIIVCPSYYEEYSAGRNNESLREYVFSRDKVLKTQ